MSGGQLTVPMVLRTQGVAGYRGGAQHSQSLESWLTHVPGLKVVMPSRGSDAVGPARFRRDRDGRASQVDLPIDCDVASGCLTTKEARCTTT
jgi:Transketolase, pyrimidine binding domain